MAGAAMGAFASGLWTAPAAYYAFKGGYMTHGVIHVIASVAAVVIAATIMHLSGDQAGERTQRNRLKNKKIELLRDLVDRAQRDQSPTEQCW